MGIPSWAVPGAKVVCIAGEGRWRAHDGGDVFTPPLFGCVYTIIAVTHDAEGVFFAFDELPHDCIWSAAWFRPAVDDATEAKLFHARKAPQGLQEEEQA